MIDWWGGGIHLSTSLRADVMLIGFCDRLPGCEEDGNWISAAHEIWIWPQSVSLSRFCCRRAAMDRRGPAGDSELYKRTFMTADNGNPRHGF